MFKPDGIQPITYMGKRIILMQQPLSATLCAIHKGDLMASDSEFAVLEQFINTMKLIVEITETIRGNNINYKTTVT